MSPEQNRLEDGIHTRIHRGWLDGSPIPGAQMWAGFFRGHERRSEETVLMGRWAGAETASTEYGRTLAQQHHLQPNAGELALYEESTFFRQVITARSYSPAVGLGAFGGDFAAIFDPAAPSFTSATIVALIYSNAMQ